MTSLNNPVKLPLDANGNVLANLNAQNITPNAKATNITLDANGNVLANVNAQNITPNANTVNNPTIANPYSLTLLSHQTGLSASVSTADTPVNIGSAISITKNGIILISIKGHVSGGDGIIDFTLTRNGVTYYFSFAGSSTNLSMSMWNNFQTATNLTETSSSSLIPMYMFTSVGVVVETDVIKIGVLNGDSIQFRASNNTASTTTYIDDLVVIEQ